MSTPDALEQFRTELVPGSGVAVRAPGIALFAEPGTDRDAATRQLVDLVRSVVDASGGGAVGMQLARRLAGILGEAEGDTFPPFGFLATADTGYVVFLYGPVAATVTGDEDLRLSGALSATWVDRVFPGAVTSVHLGPDAAAPPETGDAFRFELDAGVVPAGGLSVVRRDAADRSTAPEESSSRPAAQAPAAEAPAAEPSAPPPPTTPPRPPSPPPSADQRDEAEPPTEPMSTTPPASSPSTSTLAPEPEVDLDVRFESISLRVPDAEAREPLPLESEEPSDETPVVEDEGAQVQGIMCSRGHFNDPDSSYCSVCGISMVHQTHNLVTGPRPPLGFLVFDDGSTYSLDQEYVIGREPDEDTKILSGDARPLTIDDPERSISRVHAEIVLDGWSVKVRDRGSTNGTYLWDAARQQWNAVGQDDATLVEPAGRVAVGQRTFLFETPHRGRG